MEFNGSIQSLKSLKLLSVAMIAIAMSGGLAFGVDLADVVDPVAVGGEMPAAAVKKYGRYCLPGHCRAGCPSNVGRFAHLAVTERNTVGYIGGGAPLALFGEPRRPAEGIFGLDYSGWHFDRIVFMKWSHGLRYQGGAGAYKTDGPKLLE